MRRLTKFFAIMLLAASLIAGVGWAVTQCPDDKPELGVGLKTIPNVGQPRARSEKARVDLYGELLRPKRSGGSSCFRLFWHWRAAAVARIRETPASNRPAATRTMSSLSPFPNSLSL